MASSAARRAKLEELKKARDSGTKNGYKSTTSNKPVYDELSESDYRMVVKSRLDEDDFIVDDDGSGYADNGMDDVWEKSWPGDGVEYDDESDESEGEGKKKKKKKTKVPPKPTTTKRPTNANAFSSTSRNKLHKANANTSALSAAASASLAANPYKNPLGSKKDKEKGKGKEGGGISKDQEDNFMNDLLGGLGDGGGGGGTGRKGKEKERVGAPVRSSILAGSRKRKNDFDWGESPSGSGRRNSDDDPTSSSDGPLGLSDPSSGGFDELMIPGSVTKKRKVMNGVGIGGRAGKDKVGQGVEEGLAGVDLDGHRGDGNGDFGTNLTMDLDDDDITGVMGDTGMMMGDESLDTLKGGLDNKKKDNDDDDDEEDEGFETKAFDLGVGTGRIGRVSAKDNNIKGKGKARQLVNVASDHTVMMKKKREEEEEQRKRKPGGGEPLLSNDADDGGMQLDQEEQKPSIQPSSSKPSKPPTKVRGVDWQKATEHLNTLPTLPSSEAEPELPSSEPDEDDLGVAKTKTKKPEGDMEEEEELPQPEILKRKKKGKKQPLEVPSAHEGPKIEAFEVKDEKVAKEGEKDADEKLRFYWMDYREERNGVVRLIGKVWDRAGGGGSSKDGNTKKGDGVWRSCCVEVRGIMRNLFVLPKWKDHKKEIKHLESMMKKAKTGKGKKKRTDEDDSDSGDDSSNESDEDVEEGTTEDEVEEELENIRDQHGIDGWMAKFVIRKYAFELQDVPRKSKWYKILYPFDQPQLPLNLSGATFSHVFGTNQSAFEILVIKRKIVGPCWLEVTNPIIREKADKPTSWCKLEVVIDDPKDLRPFPDTDPNAPKDTPPITLTSLSLRTVVNHRENKSEVVCATIRTYPDVNLDDPTPVERLVSTAHTFIRPLMGSFPEGFQKLVNTGGGSKVTISSNEKMLLNALLAYIFRQDPDVIIGHEFGGVALDVLLSRMKELGTDHWSRLGRFQYGRKVIPKLRQGSNINLVAGRLVCDLSSDGSKGIIASTTWSMTEMCETYLGVQREDIDPDDTPDYFDPSPKNAQNLVKFVRHCEADAYFQVAIAFRTQILPLTKQLTNLAGNSWNKTLNGGRAERNEYILLHEFHRQKTVCPDKISRWEAKAMTKAQGFKDAKKEEDGGEGDGEDEKGEKKAASSKKDKYKGGLVIEPEKGLWDTFILVMDFNSLYPSIIQEFNIDFTTIDRSTSEKEEGDNMPNLPSSDVGQGVLPRLIYTLVERRRQVKKAMKDKSATPAKKLQYDIKQLALKLTANSMYGCLGFEGSRFYARPLAALITFKGREILTNTVELARNQQLQVIYGDTDSVMINTNVLTASEAMKIGNEFKKMVNEKYRLLEIDIDAVFQRMLLLQKKKYAARKINDNGEATIEVKGLDMKRREYSALSKAFSQFVLDRILSGDPTETVVESIHEYLASESARVRKGDIDLDEFIIWKRLGKNPEEYPDAKSQPHVQVALRMKVRGQSAHAGDVIPYVFCLGEGETNNKRTTTKVAQADKAHHPDELRKSGSTLKIDYEFYLSNQVLPPIERLCASIEGTDRIRLAECLGLDPSRYRTQTTTEEVEKEFQTLESQIPDSERFRDSDPLKIRCPHCEMEIVFKGLYDLSSGIIRASGLICCNSSCSKSLPIPSISVQLELQIRSYLQKFYEAWLICDDQSCGIRTRQMGVYSKRCLQKGCRGNMSFEYSDSNLYTQLLFFDRMFDIEHARELATGTSKYDEVFALSEHNREALTLLSSCVKQHLDKNARRFISLSSLFGFMDRVKERMKGR